MDYAVSRMGRQGAASEWSDDVIVQLNRSDGRYGRCRSMRSKVKRSYPRLNCSIDMFSVDEEGADSEDGIRTDSAFMPGDSEGKAFFAACVEDKKNMRYIPSLIDGLATKWTLASLSCFAPLLLPSLIMPSAALRVRVRLLHTV